MKKFLIIVMAILLIISVSIVLQQVNRRNIMNDFEHMTDEIAKYMREYIPNMLKDKERVTDSSCTYTSSFRQNSNPTYYEWEERYTIIVYIADDFDNLSTKKQYQYIDNMGDMIDEYVIFTVNTVFPEHREFSNSYGKWKQIYDELVFNHLDIVIQFQTSKHRYEYSTLIADYFVKDNKDVYVRDDDGNWTGRNANNRIIISHDGICVLKHCNAKIKDGSPYCPTHSCCVEGCYNQKEWSVHCCSEHNCAEPGCGAHRYEYENSKYCKIHYGKHTN